MPLSRQRIAEIVEEGLAMYRKGDETLALERAAGRRCSCCNDPMVERSPTGECERCRSM